MGLADFNDHAEDPVRFPDFNGIRWWVVFESACGIDIIVALVYGV